MMNNKMIKERKRKEKKRIKEREKERKIYKYKYTIVFLLSIKFVSIWIEMLARNSYSLWTSFSILFVAELS